MICPACKGLSPDKATMDAQLAATGDTSGACSVCHNTHEIPTREEHALVHAEAAGMRALLQKRLDVYKEFLAENRERPRAERAIEEHEAALRGDAGRALLAEVARLRDTTEKWQKAMPTVAQVEECATWWYDHPRYGTHSISLVVRDGEVDGENHDHTHGGDPPLKAISEDWWWMPNPPPPRPKR